jgi:hypothetical protein
LFLRFAVCLFVAARDVQQSERRHGMARHSLSILGGTRRCDFGNSSLSDRRYFGDGGALRLKVVDTTAAYDTRSSKPFPIIGERQESFRLRWYEKKIDIRIEGKTAMQTVIREPITGGEPGGSPTVGKSADRQDPS